MLAQNVVGRLAAMPDARFFLLRAEGMGWRICDELK
jgi:hypothetical protein